ncbi:MAG: 5'-nucleotidase C-terminal domain-containing protein [Firmicutes bacterium]|jgi:2',3'-cyclic-nucleotide 2'-phosphodiesterase/3'-nucleotidase|nr:5'-nucleotidase C-terminal domain-containing protein [Bacillota bacterium]
MLRNRLFGVLGLVLLVVVLSVPALGASRVDLVVLATTDLHGHIHPIDYFTSKLDEGGLAQVATYVASVGAETPNVLLVDNGDCLEGGNSTLPYHYMFDSEATNPMIRVMNLIGYDSMTIGNHEFNYGLGVLRNAAAEARFPIISANVLGTDGKPYFEPYYINDFGEFHVGVLGLTTPKVPIWEKPENIRGLLFADPVVEAKHWVTEMRSNGADVVVIVAHTGRESRPKDSSNPDRWLVPTDWVDTGQQEENYALRLANEVPGVDVLVVGYDHLAVPGVTKMGDIVKSDVIIVQPGFWGDYVSRVDIVLEQAGGKWNAVQKTGSLIPMADVKPDEQVLAEAKCYHDQTVEYFKQPVAMAKAHMPGGIPARFYDSALVELINLSQLWATGADISCAALFTDQAKITQGPISVQDVYGLYIYPNTLYTIKVTGKQVREALEHSARYFNVYTGQAGLAEIVNPSIRGYNYDIYQGVECKIDISRPVGQRIVELKYKGEEVQPDQEFVLALNNCRAGEGGGYTMFGGSPILYESTKEAREVIVEYLRSIGTFDPAVAVDNNWSILPASLREMARPR